MKYSIHLTKLFKKQNKKVIRQGKSQKKIQSIVLKLACGISLPIHFRVHKLSGRYQGCHELHIEPDLLLIYRYKEGSIIELVAIGSHSELFG